MLKSLPHGLIATVLIAGVASWAGVAHGQADIVSPDTVHGVADLRLVAADGEASFTKGGFGKTRYSKGWRLDLAQAAIAWKPRLGWDWSAVIDAAWQPGQTRAFDLVQGYLAWKPVPRSDTRFTARAGLFYPPVSLEHDAPVWGITDTITPSALNSWMGEEVKVLGLEAGVARRFGEQRLALTAAVFGYDDTAGTLLTYRGWALHDLKATAGGEFGLPPMSAFGRRVQPPFTYSTREIDHRLGAYARAEWSPTGAVALHAFHYDNGGDKVGVDRDGQWAWRTQFSEAGVSLRLDDDTRVLAQAMTGRTRFGFETGAGLWADVGFHAGYVLVSRKLSNASVTGRLDLFDVTDHSLQAIDNNAEHGWAVAGAWRRPLTPHADLRFEALHVWSDRPGRAYGGLAPVEAQTLVQSSLRLSF